MDSQHKTNPIIPQGVDLLVLHVKKGYEERDTHIRKMLGRMGLDFKYILDGDIPDLTPERVAACFAGKMNAIHPESSCAMKHLLAYRHIVDNNLDGALILEDDIMLSKKFAPVFVQSMREMAERDPAVPTLISYEDTQLRFVPRSKRVKGQVLYPSQVRDRMTGAYYVNRATARLLLDCAERGEIDCPIDIFHARLLKDGRLDYLWCEPTIATQGSHYGLFASGIQNYSRWDATRWRIRKAYRKVVYFLK